jgi:thiol-disulfide isomerase/thioredoxin
MPFLALFLAGVLLTNAPPQAQAAEVKLMQTMAANLAAPTLQFSDGERPVSLSAFEGKYVLANFWATWCAPCIQEMPALHRLSEKLEKKSVVVVAISQDEAGPAQVRPFVEKLKLSRLTILYDMEKSAIQAYALRGLPTTFLISPTGMLLARLEGSAAWDEGALAEQVINWVSK